MVRGIRLVAGVLQAGVRRRCSQCYDRRTPRERRFYSSIVRETGIESRLRPRRSGGGVFSVGKSQRNGECAMKPNPKISAAVAAILSASAPAVVFAAAETATATGTGTELQEVVVTAERRAES